MTKLKTYKIVFMTFHILLYFPPPPLPDCLIELEPMLRRFDEIDVLEAVLEVKRSKVSVKKE